MNHPILGIVIVISALAAMMAWVRQMGARFNVHPELQRKSVHIGMGLITLWFPWIFNDPWPVVLLAVLAVAGLLAMKWVRPLKARIGGALHGVERSSLGEIYFPLAVALLFVLAGDMPVLYMVPILVLTLADAVAAIIGVRYGNHPYSTSEGHKSAEGSLAFFLTAFGSTFLPVLLMTDVPAGKVIVGALLIGLLVMLFEAISVGGLDNLFIPVGCYALLESYRDLSGQGLLYRLIALGLLGVFIYTWRLQTTLKGSALLAALLTGYMNWMVGGWPYLAVSMILLSTYTRLWPGSKENRYSIHSVRAIAAVVAPGIVWLLATARSARPEYLFCFILCYATHSVIIGMLQLGYACPQQDIWRRSAEAVLRSWLVFIPAYFLLYLTADRTVLPLAGALTAALMALPLLSAAVALYLLLSPLLGQNPQDRIRWLGYGTIALSVSLAGAVFYV